MTIVVELRGLKKSLPRPVAHLWQHAVEALSVSRIRLACLGLLALTLGYPIDAGAAPRDGVLERLCAVLTAAVAATSGVVCDASHGLDWLLGESANPAFGFEQRLGLCFVQPGLPFDICPAAGPFPTLSAHRLCALVACALFLFGSGFGHRGKPANRGLGR